MNTSRLTLPALAVPLLAGAMTLAASGAAANPPKAAGSIRIGVAPAEAQLGQGSTAQVDHGGAIRNSIVLLMSGPAVDVIPLESHLAMQLEAEAAQKQCDFILYSASP